FFTHYSKCKDFNSGTTGGNLCHDLCVSKELAIQDCLAHKNTTIVFSGTWKNNDIVFKTKREPHHFEKLEDLLYSGPSDDQPLDHEDRINQLFISHVSDHVKNELSFFGPNDIITEQRILELLWEPHPLGKLSWEDMSSLWLLIQRDEFIKLQLLQDMKHIPRVYGFCGRFYAVERVETLEEFSFSPFKKPMAWKKRLKTALDFLDLSEEFSNTTLGKLHHCDIQPGNFGITKDKRVVALDIDTVFPNKQMEDYLEQPTCESNKQCDFFDCVSACNITEHQCSRNLLTNNLQVICRDILLSYWGQPGLLQRAPIHAQNKISPVLSECASETLLPWKPGKIERIHRKLKRILSEELVSN
ncbi:LOW QUALITY PROTEIN: divergent protein kinase domain 1C-like, partial [Oculina patagonica]